MTYFRWFSAPLISLTPADESKHCNTATNCKPRLPFLKPKPSSTGSAFRPVPSKSVSAAAADDTCTAAGKRASLCSQEVCRAMAEFKLSAESIADDGRPQSPVPADDEGREFTSAEPTRGSSRRRNVFGTISPVQQQPLPTFPRGSPTIGRPAAAAFTAVTECAFKTNPANDSWSPAGLFQLNRRHLSEFHGARGPISAAMEIAPDRPFTPVAVTEAIIKPAPWIPLPDAENDCGRPESPLVAALKTAPERSYSPLPSFVYADEVIAVGRAATTSLTRPVGNDPVRYVHGYYNNKTPVAVLGTIAESTPRLPSQQLSTPTVAAAVAVVNPGGRCSPPRRSFDRPVDRRGDTSLTLRNDSETFVVKRATDFDGNDEKSPRPQNTVAVPSAASEEKSTLNRSIGPGIKNKLSAFTPANAPVRSVGAGDTFFKRPTNDNNNPNAVKLIKAVPFFSNGTSSSLSSSP